GRWPTSRPAPSRPTPPGRSAPPSAITCSVWPAPSPAAATRSPAAPPCAANSSLSRPDSLDRNAAECCTYPHTGPGHGNGPPCGTPQPAHRPQPESRTPTETTVEKLGRPADVRYPPIPQLIHKII